MSIKKNLTYNITYQIFQMIIPLITVPYVSRILGVEGVGIYSYTHSIASYFILFAMLGLNNYGNRTIAIVRDDKTKLSTTFWSIYAIQLIASILVLSVYVVFLINTQHMFQSIFLAQLVFVASAFLDINWFFFGLEEFRITVTRNVVIKIITTISIFIFVDTADDLITYVLLMAFGTFISQFILWFFVKSHIKFIKPSFMEIISHIKPNLTLFIPVIAVSMYRIMDKIMIGTLSNMTQSGLYENADRITLIPMTLITALGTVMLPKMSNLMANGKLEQSKKYIRDSMQFALFLSIAIIFGIIAVSESFVLLYFGEQFYESGKLISWLSPVILFASWANVIRTQYLIPKGKDKIYIISVLLGAAINLLLNLFLIRKYGAFGAVIGTLAAEFSVMAYQTYAIKSELPFSDYIKDNMPFLFSGIIMFLIVNTLNYLIDNTIILLISQVFVGIASYTIFACILLNRWDKERFYYLLKISGIREVITKKIK